VTIAKEHGHEFTADKLSQLQSELSDRELEGVAGGVITQDVLMRTIVIGAENV
jgi:hypothetical protein